MVLRSADTGRSIDCARCTAINIYKDNIEGSSSDTSAEISDEKQASLLADHTHCHIIN
jgi:hypothetical protein